MHALKQFGSFSYVDYFELFTVHTTLIWCFNSASVLFSDYHDRCIEENIDHPNHSLSNLFSISCNSCLYLDQDTPVRLIVPLSRCIITEICSLDLHLDFENTFHLVLHLSGFLFIRKGHWWLSDRIGHIKIKLQIPHVGWQVRSTLIFIS